MNHEHNQGLVIGLEKPVAENRRVAESQPTFEAQPKLDKNFRQRLGNLFLRAVFGKSGLFDMAQQEQRASVRPQPTIEISPAVPIEKIKWAASEGVPPVIGSTEPYTNVRATAAMPQETQPNYTEAQQIKARVANDMSHRVGTVYSGRLVGEESHSGESK